MARPTTRAGRAERAGQRRGQTAGQHRLSDRAKRREENFKPGPTWHYCDHENGERYACNDFVPGGDHDLDLPHVCVTGHYTNEQCDYAARVAAEVGLMGAAR